MQFHENLMRLRKQNGLSQEELGNQLDVSRQTVSKWELGQTTPEMDKLMALSELFGVSIDCLVGKENNTVCAEKPLSMTERWHYEYKSEKTFKGIPLVHVNLGVGMYRAKGLIAVGNIATGLLSNLNFDTFSAYLDKINAPNIIKDIFSSFVSSQI